MAYKTFANGFPLPASDLNNYLMNQSVIVFANSTARDAALPTPTEGMLTYLEDTNLLEVYNGSAWSDINDNTAAIPKSTVTTAGDLIVADGASSVTRLGVGADGSLVTVAAGSPTYLAPGTDDQVLTLASGAPVWADAGGGGGGGEWSLIFDGSLGGVTSTTVSGLAGHDEYYIDIPNHDRTSNLGYEYTYFRVNGQTSGYTYSLRQSRLGNFTRIQSSSAAQIILYQQAQTQPQNINVHITGGAGTGHCVMSMMSATDNYAAEYFFYDGYAVAPLGGNALDSVTIFQANGANAANGTIRIWGK